MRGLEKRYAGRTVVHGVSFCVSAGEVFAILGPNGAGKTTTIETLEGYRSPDAGAVRVLGLDPVRQGNQLRPRIGLMLQQGGVYPLLTPPEVLRLFADFYPRAEDPALLMRQLDLERLRKTRYRSLSGGEKQRVNLALALVGRPELVFLDEPTAAMDPRARRATWDVIRELKGRGVTVLLTTHFMDEAEHLADRVAIMSGGKLVALDTPAALRARGGDRVYLRVVPPLSREDVAILLGVDQSAVQPVDGDGWQVQLEATPASVRELTRRLGEFGRLLVEWRVGSRTLEQAYLDITGKAGE